MVADVTRQTVGVSELQRDDGSDETAWKLRDHGPRAKANGRQRGV